MRGRWGLRASLVVSLALAACGGAVTRSARLEASGSRAYAAGRYDEAAKAFHAAADAAPPGDDRDEARYREARALLRAGRVEEGRRVLGELLAASPRGDRAARAAHDRAVAAIEHGDAAAGHAELERMIDAFPDSGVAPLALRRALAHVAPRGEPAVREWLDRRLSRLEATELGQYLHFAYAESLERSSDLAAARDRYLLVAERHPYPEGALWDDALFEAARLEERLQRPAEAVALLTRMLAKRETAYFQGSYERGRYAEARFRIAELQRDALGDPAAARKTFELLWSAHRTSRLRDDAAWQAARLAVDAHDDAGACRLLGALVEELPDSRYAACAPFLCAELSRKVGPGRCHEYVTRGLRGSTGAETR